jgi:hypothetical protein
VGSLIGATTFRAIKHFTANKVSVMLAVIYHVTLIVIFQASISAHPLATVPVATGRLETRRAMTKSSMSIFHPVSEARKGVASEQLGKAAA